jgi:hypothetical protein
MTNLNYTKKKGYNLFLILEEDYAKDLEDNLSLGCLVDARFLEYCS